LTFEILDGSFVIDMSTTKSLRIHQGTRGPDPEFADYALLSVPGFGVRG
jgi:hypothetical protein